MRKVISYLLCGVVGIFIGLFAFKVYAALIQYDKSASFYDSVSKEVVKVCTPTQNVQETQDSVEVEIPWHKQIYVDLESLQLENSDVVGWIYFEDVDINYPIVHSENNTDYLRRLYTGVDNQAGSIILETTNSPLFTDTHSIVYGHNMKDLSMFGKLRYYQQDPEYLDAHKYFQIFTNDTIYRYQIVGWQEVAKDSNIYQTSFTDIETFEEFKETYLLKDVTDIVETPFNQWVTLSTCLVGDQRLTVTAVCVDSIGRVPK